MKAIAPWHDIKRMAPKKGEVVLVCQLTPLDEMDWLRVSVHVFKEVPVDFRYWMRLPKACPYGPLVVDKVLYMMGKFLRRVQAKNLLAKFKFGKLKKGPVLPTGKNIEFFRLGDPRAVMDGAPATFGRETHAR